MIKLYDHGVYISHQHGIICADNRSAAVEEKEEARKRTISWSILSAHNTSGDDHKLKIKFDSMASHDITFVGIIQTAKEGANKRGNSSRLTQSFHFFMFEPIFSPVNALNQPI